MRSRRQSSVKDKWHARQADSTEDPGQEVLGQRGNTAHLAKSRLSNAVPSG